LSQEQLEKKEEMIIAKGRSFLGNIITMLYLCTPQKQKTIKAVIGKRQTRLRQVKGLSKPAEAYGARLLQQQGDSVHQIGATMKAASQCPEEVPDTGISLGHCFPVHTAVKCRHSYPKRAYIQLFPHLPCSP
jgi:hypothetical protein